MCSCGGSPPCVTPSRRITALVEAAVETLGSLAAAERAGVARIELCASLSEGGITPSSGFIAAATARAIPVVVMIRARGGGFIYSREEIALMRHDLETALSLGASGIATGALKPNGEIDLDSTRSLVAAAGKIPVTFHRAFDSTPNPAIALDQLIDLGVSRVLTSGGAPSAAEGANAIAHLVEQASGRITVIAAGRIRENNVREIITRTGVKEVHARALDEARMRALVGLARGSPQG